MADSTSTRTPEQIKGAATAMAELARNIGNDPMASPQDKEFREVLHKGMDAELTRLENRQSGS